MLLLVGIFILITMVPILKGPKDNGYRPEDATAKRIHSHFSKSFKQPRKRRSRPRNLLDLKLDRIPERRRGVVIEPPGFMLYHNWITRFAHITHDIDSNVRSVAVSVMKCSGGVVCPFAVCVADALPR